ncbi:MAG TPA: type II CAAX endopeptidase family protein [Deltaproteobacteria bacterium]|nr:type II CAAX endopeptidase family protein [Deltaproteobacteria bacterium]HPX49805.1 type II CAAX endopeptidase family protein [Deltaproteobacteria bacterium]HQA71643.1 type II CAAX endopeptidase family protein [Deltaproteobacteria bacterium]
MDQEDREILPESVPAFHPSRKVQFFEVTVYLFLIVPSMILSLFAVRQVTVGFALTAFDTIFRDSAMVALILFLLWRNRERVSSIGWRFENSGREILAGVVLFPAVFYFTGLLGSILQEIGFSSPPVSQASFLTPDDPVQMGLAFFLVVVVAIAEETIFRGYLLLRFMNLGLGRVGAVIASSFVFSLGHGYEGSAGVITVGATGAVLAIVYIWRGNLIAPVVIHFLQNLTAILLLPLVSAQ